MDASTSTGKLINTLRQQLRIKGLHYHDVALHLKVSEGTVKRYFSGKGINIEVLDRLADLVDLDFLALAALAQQQQVSEPGLSKAQKAVLKKHKMMGIVLWYLNIGFTPAKLIEEFELGEQIDDILSRLQDLGLIRRLSANKVKVLVKPSAGGPVDEDVRAGRIKLTRRFLSEINLQDDKCEWSWFYARLSKASVTRLRELLKRFASDVQATAKTAIDLSPNDTQWYQLFVGAEPTSRKNIFR